MCSLALLSCYPGAMGVETFFAPAERASAEVLASEVASVVGNPIVDALLETAGGLLAVLNEHRQVLAVNHALLRLLGVADPAALVGLRPGEVVGCDHAAAPPAGCGTTPYCTTCGAAISIVGALSTEQDVERKCVLTVARQGQPADLCLRVRAHVMHMDQRRFVLLFLQDVTSQERLSAVQRTFFHDLRNLLMGLQGSAQLLELCTDAERPEVVETIAKIGAQLGAELNLQQMLTGDGTLATVGARRPLDVSVVFTDLAALVKNHRSRADKTLDVVLPEPGLSVVADSVFLQRVLLNMLINAFEASETGGTVRMQCERFDVGTARWLRFKVWNATVIPPAIQLRVFQRHFSTKSEFGRGVGTWSMKLLGEQFLHGRVGFQSEVGAGTTFYLELPAALV